MLRSFYTFVRVYVRFPSLSFFSFISSTSFQPTPRPFVPPRAIFILLYPNCVYTPRCTYKYNIEKTNGREHRPKEISLIFHNRASYLPSTRSKASFLLFFSLVSLEPEVSMMKKKKKEKERKEELPLKVLTSLHPKRSAISKRRFRSFSSLSLPPSKCISSTSPYRTCLADSFFLFLRLFSLTLSLPLLFLLRISQ